MSVHSAREALGAISCINTGRLASTKLTDSGADAVDVTRTGRRLFTLPTYKITLLRTAAPCLLT